MCRKETTHSLTHRINGLGRTGRKHKHGKPYENAEVVRRTTPKA